MSARVLVAMSGGVDSSVAAAFLRERGYDVVGVAMRLAPESAGSIGGAAARYLLLARGFRGRAPGRGADGFSVLCGRSARGVWRPRDRTISSPNMSRGRTPNPCVMCNREIKFDRLRERAAALGADYVATGHYAHIERDPRGRFHLLRAADAAKDQSYFLFTLGQASSPHAVSARRDDQGPRCARARARLVSPTPTRPRARRFVSCPTAIMPASSSGRRRRSVFAPAVSSIQRGRRWPTHGGVHRFTVGQRRGLGLSAPRRYTCGRFAPRAARSSSVRAKDSARRASSRATSASSIPTASAPAQSQSRRSIRYRHPGAARVAARSNRAAARA